MYFTTADGERYTEIRNLSFGAEADLYGEALPMNMLSLDVRTDDDISVGTIGTVYDDTGVSWFFGWVTYSEEADAAFRHIEISSPLKGLDEHTLPQRMILKSENRTFGYLTWELLTENMHEWMINGVAAPTSINNKVIYGYFPEQSARERLLWYCTAVGVYARDYFPHDMVGLSFIPYNYNHDEGDLFYTNYMQTNLAFVDQSRVFWKPSLTFMDYVTAVEVNYFAYELSTEGISRLDEYVDILKEGLDPETANPSNPENFDTYIQLTNTFRLDNPNVPPKIPENVVKLDSMTCINGDNVNQIAMRLAMYYFNRVEVSMDLVNNGDVLAGMILMAPIDDSRYAIGHVRSTDFSTGLQSRTSIVMTGVKIKDFSKDGEGDDDDDFYDPWDIFNMKVGRLQIRYVWNGEVVEEGHRIELPVGTPYTVDNNYVKVVWHADDHTWILRPETEKTSGVMQAGSNVIDVNMYEALEWLDGTLRVISVDSSSVDGETSAGSIVRFE